MLSSLCRILCVICETEAFKVGLKQFCQTILIFETTKSNTPTTQQDHAPFRMSYFHFKTRPSFLIGCRRVCGQEWFTNHAQCVSLGLNPSHLVVYKGTACTLKYFSLTPIQRVN